MSDINSILNKLLKFYDLDTLSELSEVLKVSQPTISKWRARNTIIPIKKKCKEIGIYDKIFDNYTLDDFDFTKIDKIKTLEQECKKYNIQTTTIKNKKILNLFEILYRDFAVDNNSEIDNNFEKLENDIKKLILKYNPKIDKKMEDKFLEFIDKESEKENL
ncbi:hypothetical protein [Aliarcobacter cryaerophilus]|uniref:hypothetical protein n=1 Tax=Aliarcobacter cryaerophilus TaxID=28198 RepID=UPI003AF3E6D3